MRHIVKCSAGALEHSRASGADEFFRRPIWPSEDDLEKAETELTATKRPVWHAARTVGTKRALKPKQIWEIRFYLNQRRRLRDQALFDLAIDSKLRGCDLVHTRIGNLVDGGQIRTRAIVMQQKTGRPVQFELLPDARASLLA